jgi:hypothetical protein
MKLLMPLRVPELAPSLGRIIVPRRLLDPWVPLEDIREELATRVLELGGEGRAAAAREAEGTVDRARVLEVRAARLGRCVGSCRAARGYARWGAGREITRAARKSACRAAASEPLAQQRGETRDRGAARHGRRTFVAALDELEAPRPRSPMPRCWRKTRTRPGRTRCTVARRLEAAGSPSRRKSRRTSSLESRDRRDRSLASFAVARIVFWLPFAAVLVWLGLIVGGYILAPAWLARQLGF